MNIDTSNGAVPRQRRSVTLVRDDAGSSLLARDGSLLCELNDTAAALWELCDGTTQVAEMVLAVCEACAVTPEQAAEDVQRTLEALTAADLLRWEDVGGRAQGGGTDAKSS